MRAIRCRVGLHRWKRYALPLSLFEEDALRLGYPVGVRWAYACANCPKARTRG